VEEKPPAENSRVYTGGWFAKDLFGLVQALFELED